MEYRHLTHGFPPLCSPDAEILILGSFPSVKSREISFYYGHPQNRFWRVMSDILGAPLPETVAEKTALMQAHKIALWDVIEACDILGSSDASVKNVTPTDVAGLIADSRIRAVFCNGKLAGRLYEAHQKAISLPHFVLPSTSPANASVSLAALTASWREAVEPYLEIQKVTHI